MRAVMCVMTPEICYTSARKSGMWPLNINEVLSEELIIPELVIDRLKPNKPKRQKPGPKLNSRILTEESVIHEIQQYICSKDDSILHSFNFQTPYIDEIIRICYASKKSFFLMTPPESLFKALFDGITLNVSDGKHSFKSSPNIKSRKSAFTIKLEKFLKNIAF
jgi:hypothetical protein